MKKLLLLGLIALLAITTVTAQGWGSGSQVQNSETEWDYCPGFDDPTMGGCGGRW